MKFVHIADVHFDMPFTSIRYSKKIINQRRIDAKNVFFDTINFVKDINAEMLFISGDLFEQRFVENDTINFIISCLKRISDTKVFVSPGNHDPLITNSPYNIFEWPDNVIIFSGDIQMYEYGDIIIYGDAFINFEKEENEIQRIELDENRVNILVTHGTLNGAGHKYNDIKSNDLKNFDYVALGHIHLPKVDNSRIIYPGSLVAGGLDESGEHGLVYGEINKEKCDISFKKMDVRQFKEIQVELKESDEDKSANEIIASLNLQKDIYKINFIGRRVSYISQLVELLKNSEAFICDIKDNTEMPYDLKSIVEEKTLRGIFTKKMLEKLEQNPEDKEEIYKAIDIVFQQMKH